MNFNYWGRWATVISLFLLQGGASLVAQPELYNPLNEKIYEQAYDLLRTTSLTQVAVKEGKPYLKAFFSQKFVREDSLQTAYLQTKKALAKKDMGLRLTAGYRANDDERGYEGLDIGSWARAGFEWHFLEGGWLAGNTEADQLDKAIRLHALEQIIAQKKVNYPYLYNQVIWAFNNQKAKLLKQRKYFLERLVVIYTELFHAHDLTHNEVLAVKKKLEETKILFATYREFNHAYKKANTKESFGLNAGLLPVVIVQLEQLLEDPARLQLMDEIYAANCAILNRKNKWTDSWRLSVYGAYNFRSQNAVPVNSHASFGVRFSLPVNFQKNKQTTLMELEREMLRRRKDDESYNDSRELMNLFQEYNYKLKQYVTFQHKQQHLSEQLRVEKIHLSDEARPYSPLRALTYLDTQMEVQLELTDLKQQMYLYLLKMHSRDFHPDFTDCLELASFEKIKQKLSGDRYLVFDPADSRGLEETFYAAYLLKNEFQTILLPASCPRYWIGYFKENGFRVFLEQSDTLPKTKWAGLDGYFRFAIFQNKIQVVWENELLSPLLLTTVPTDLFANRNELESWIDMLKSEQPEFGFLFKSIRPLIQLDQKNLSLVGHENF
ncbi:MAG: hypothetical protein AAFZ15_24025 [Bacteroidota bacterium]